MKAIHKENMESNGYFIANSVFFKEEVPFILNQIDEFIRASQEITADKLVLGLEDLSATGTKLPEELCKQLMSDGHSLSSVENLIKSREMQNLFAELAGTERIDSILYRLRLSNPYIHSYNHNWHQDRLDGDNTQDCFLKYSVWIPLCDISKNTGGLEVIKHGQKKGPMNHVFGETGAHGYIDENLLEIKDCIQLECRLGEFIVLDPYIPHRTAKNDSGKVRWAIAIWIFCRKQESASPS